MRGPECNCRGAGAGALKADLSQMQLFRREVGVGRVVLVEATDRRIPKEDAAASIGLQAVLVRIDDDGVGFADCSKRATGRLIQCFRDKAEITAVSRIDMDTEAVSLAQCEDLIERVDCSDRRGAESDDGAEGRNEGEGEIPPPAPQWRGQAGPVRNRAAW